MPLSLPISVSTYFEISNGADDARIAHCFAQDAVVADEGRTHQGLDAIRSWLREARKKFEYAVEPASVSREGDRLTVRANVVGNFPGSPIQLDHVFELSGDRIQSLKIG